MWENIEISTSPHFPSTSSSSSSSILPIGSNLIYNTRRYDMPVKLNVFYLYRLVV